MAVEVMGGAVLHFVCDSCGNYWTAYRASACPACHHGAVWEFDRAKPAREHAAGIRHLFRKAGA